MRRGMCSQEGLPPRAGDGLRAVHACLQRSGSPKPLGSRPHGPARGAFFGVRRSPPLSFLSFSLLKEKKAAETAALQKRQSRRAAPLFSLSSADSFLL